MQEAFMYRIVPFVPDPTQPWHDQLAALLQDETADGSWLVTTMTYEEPVIQTAWMAAARRNIPTTVLILARER